MKVSNCDTPFGVLFLSNRLGIVAAVMVGIDGTTSGSLKQPGLG